MLRGIPLLGAVCLSSMHCVLLDIVFGQAPVTPPTHPHLDPVSANTDMHLVNHCIAGWGNALGQLLLEHATNDS